MWSPSSSPELSLGTHRIHAPTRIISMVRISAFLTLAVSLWLPAVAGAQVDPRTALLERDGFQALAAGQAHRAAEAFRHAPPAGPGRPRLPLGAGAGARRAPPEPGR